MQAISLADYLNAINNYGASIAGRRQRDLAAAQRANATGAAIGGTLGAIAGSFGGPQAGAAGGALGSYFGGQRDSRAGGAPASQVIQSGAQGYQMGKEQQVADQNKAVDKSLVDYAATVTPPATRTSVNSPGPSTPYQPASNPEDLAGMGLMNGAGYSPAVPASVSSSQVETTSPAMAAYAANREKMLGSIQALADSGADPQRIASLVSLITPATKEYDTKKNVVSVNPLLLAAGAQNPSAQMPVTPASAAPSASPAVSSQPRVPAMLSPRAAPYNTALPSLANYTLPAGQGNAPAAASDYSAAPSVTNPGVVPATNSAAQAPNVTSNPIVGAAQPPAPGMPTGIQMLQQGTVKANTLLTPQQKLAAGFDPRDVVQVDENGNFQVKQKFSDTRLNAMTKESEIRKEYIPLRNNMKSAVASIELAYSPHRYDNIATQSGLMYGYARLINGPGILTDQDVDRTVGLGTMPGWFASMWAQVKDKKVLADWQVNQLTQAMKERYQFNYEQYAQDTQQYQRIAVSHGFNPDNVAIPLDTPTLPQLEQQQTLKDRGGFNAPPKATASANDWQVTNQRLLANPSLIDSLSLKDLAKIPASAKAKWPDSVGAAYYHRLHPGQ